MTNKLVFEAKQTNLTWLGFSKEKDYSEYQYGCGCVRTLQMSNVRAKLRSGVPYNDKCPDCQTNFTEVEISRIMTSYGGELLGRTGNRRSRFVKLPCGHEAEVWVRGIQQLGRDPKKKLKCKQCIFANYEEIGKKKGVRPLHHMKEQECVEWGVTHGDYWMWEFIKCKHKRPYQPGMVRNGDIHCKSCIEKRHNAAVLKKGLECLGRSRDVKYDINYRFYRKLDCGHEFHIARSEAESGNFRCDICLEATWRENADRCGWTFLRKASTKGAGIYKHNSCGQIEERQRSEFSQDATRVNCRNCEETSWLEPSQVYLYEIECCGEKWLKLGHADNPNTRHKKYGLPDEAKVSILATRKFENRYLAFEFEKIVGSNFSNYNLSPEKMERYHSKNGKTECYDYDIKSQVLHMVEAAKI
ncbi:hypothetical protein OAM68_02815 [Planktomarina temperata]|nr:hypothetical protein [Planktomarina temperata]